VGTRKIEIQRAWLDSILDKTTKRVSSRTYLVHPLIKMLLNDFLRKITSTGNALFMNYKSGSLARGVDLHVYHHPRL